MSPEENDSTRSSSRDSSSRERARSHTITTDDAFQEAIRAIVLEADANGVDVRGGWPVVRGDQVRAWDVEITRVSRASAAHVDETGSMIASVVEAVAAREGLETTDLPPLQETIDPNILETLLHTDGDGASQHVRFRYFGYEITVRSDGSIRIEG